MGDTESYGLQNSSVLRKRPDGQRIGPAADWAALNPVLERGEIGVTSDTGVLKVGDGSTRWSSLTGISGGGGGAAALLDKGAWGTTTAYDVGDVVTQSSQRYACRTAHTSGTFATDLAALRWVALDNGAAVPLAQSGQIPAQEPVAPGATAAVGSLAAAARADHVHPGVLSGVPFPVSVTALGASVTTATLGAGNRAYVVVNAGAAAPCTRIGYHVSVSSGNLDVGVYSPSGAAAESVPGTRKASTGSFACPAAGYVEASLSVTIAQGDYFALAADNATAQFYVGNGGNLGGNFWKGLCGFADTAFPLPSTFPAMGGNPQRVPLMKGLP